MKTSIVIISKDESQLGATLESLRGLVAGTVDQVVVVDASQRRLDGIRIAHPWVEWIDYSQPEGVRVTIPHQRNAGVLRADGDVIVFIDCGCMPQDMWLERLIAPLADESEMVTCGPATARNSNVYGGSRWAEPNDDYVSKAPTINMAFRREVFNAVDGFDETFEYGSDIDFTWRIIERGYRLRWVGDAVVEHEWGTVKRQMKRAYTYGAASARLYRKHPNRIPEALKSNPVPLLYPLYLLGLPIALKHRSYAALLLVPLWRNRHADNPLLVLGDHLMHGAGVLAELTGARR